MLTEFVVDGGKSVDRAAWLAKLAELDVACEMDPTFDIHEHEGFVRIRWQRAKAPAIDVGFDLCIGMPAQDAKPEVLAKVVARYERMHANLLTSKLPPAFAKAMKEKLVELNKPKRTQHVRIRVESKNSRPGDYAAAALCSAAYAALSGGTLNDRSNGKHYDGGDALAAMAKSNYMKMPGDDIEFTTWDAKPAKKPAKKKAAAKKR